ncbi:MAG: hypothetical protein J6E40_06415, partial [Lachnospiraceae bacterium]|nr:hypothetical protein [Lachnospiraceae bacterium]
TVCAIAIIFVTRKFLFVETFEFSATDKVPDWLSDWKEIKKTGAAEKKAAPKKAPKDAQSKYTEVNSETTEKPKDNK